MEPMEQEKESFQKKKEETVRESKIIKALVVIIVILLFLVITFIVYAVTKDTSCSCKKLNARKNDWLSCKDSSVTIQPKIIKENDIFHELNAKEINMVIRYIKKNFDIKPKGNYTIKNLHFIHSVELYLPDKLDALKYLDQNGKKPERRAIVTIVHAPYNITYYIVGPIPMPKYHNIAKFTDRKNPLPYIPDATTLARNPISRNLYKDAAKYLWPLFKNTYEILQNYNTFDEAFEGGLNFFAPGGSVQKQRGEFYTDITFTYPVHNHMRHLDMIALTVNFSSSREEEWSLSKVIYNLKAYNSTIQLMQEYNAGTLTIIKVPQIPDDTLKRANQKRRDEQADGIFPSMEPIMFSPNGPRFSVRGREVKYLDWKFNFLVQPSSGPAIFDVRYKKKRIAFEISLQEAASLYATGGPFLKFTNIIDSTWYLGKTYTLISVTDCPQQAVYLDIDAYLGTKVVSIKNAACIFEQVGSVPLRRHHHQNKNGYVYGALSDASLVVRFVTDMSNYDYIHDFVFHQNGVVEVKTTTTGHLLTSPYYAQNENKYGYQIVDNYLGGIHDHMMLFKVDLDILGTKNTFKTMDIKLETGQDAWDIRPVVKKYIKHNKHTTEKDAAIQFNFDHPKYYIISNENERNKYGNLRGYRIYVQNKVKQVYPVEHEGTKHTGWSKYQVSISKFKETERYGSCMFNYYPQYLDPTCSFDARIDDDESIENEDLVAWIPIGGLHIPCTEDYPSTPTTGNQFAFFIKPFNYFDEDPSFTSLNSVYIEENGKSKKVNAYGTPDQATCPIPTREFR
ncbi:amiloride-sensitive amine oxidase [copper-containing]-like [Hydractinia symbiolongicarpus]|uniref:amiloride-sensitive amine oxidase [copper-containing]-like n=1 Tax=Hydractinia symbiolongicarpus TaxID=13093 RepID=UPI00254E0B9C|nr:amiloride-sensitive amine oxidase [copper-containing]-like [Hydractinia symbiolongicarpus]